MRRAVIRLDARTDDADVEEGRVEIRGVGTDLGAAQLRDTTLDQSNGYRQPVNGQATHRFANHLSMDLGRDVSVVLVQREVVQVGRPVLRDDFADDVRNSPNQRVIARVIEKSRDCEPSRRPRRARNQVVVGKQEDFVGPVAALSIDLRAVGVPVYFDYHPAHRGNLTACGGSFSASSQRSNDSRRPDSDSRMT